MENNYHPRILHPVKLPINNKVNVKTLYKQKQKESATRRTSRKEMLRYYCSSIIKSCPTLCSPMDCTMPLVCPLLSPRVCSNLCPLSQWCYLTISSSAVSFSSCPQSSPASGSFPMSRLFASCGQSIGASASVLPMNIQGWLPLGLTGLISSQSKLKDVLQAKRKWLQMEEMKCIENSKYVHKCKLRSYETTIILI